MRSALISVMRRATRLIALSSIVSASLAAQNVGTIRGTVTDAGTQRPISGVQVTITGTNAAAATGANGEYTLTNVPTGQREIAARRLGYARRTVTITVSSGAENRADFVLSQTASQLEGVVVTGTAGSAEKRTVGNAITQLDASDVTKKTNSNNVIEVLQARSPGVQIQAGSGSVGTASDIRIRGAGSFTLSPPVVFIDGVRMSTAGLGNFDPSGQGLSANSGGQGMTALDLLNPNDIESIEIIKGPAASTLYGADAAGGVIQVITKKGARGQQKVSWSGSFTAGQNDLGSVTLPVNYTTCDAAKIAAPTVWPGCKSVAPGTILSGTPLRDDPAALRNGALQKMSLSAHGGGDRFSYYMSGDHSYEEGVLHNNFDRRNSLRSNFAYTPDQHADFQVTLGVIDSRIRQPLDGESAQGLLFGSQRGQPGHVGTVATDPYGWLFATPAQSNQYDNETRSDRVTLGATLNYQPFSWFHNRLTTGMDWTYGLATLFAPPFTPVLTGDTLGLTAQRVPRNTLYTLDYTGSIDHQFGANFSSNTAFGSQVVASRSEALLASGIGLGTPDISLVGSTTQISASNTYSANNSVGYFLQEQVGYKNRLYVTVADRVDNSSVFGSSINVINYPKAQVSWILSEEPSLKRYFDMLHTNSFKFRSAYGAAGKAPAPYAATRTYVVSSVTLGTTSGSALRTGSYGNPGLKPEKGQETEIGFDADLFGSRAGIEFTHYDKEMRDVLVSTSIAPSTGFRGTQQANLGAVSNKGIELALNATLLQYRNFNWESRVSLSTNHNKLLAFGDTSIHSQTPPSQSYGAVQQHRVGYPLGGYWAPYPKRNADGTLALVNGAITLGDTVYIGPAMPTREMAFSNTFTFLKDFTLYSLFDYKGGNYNYRGAELYRCASAANCIERNDPNFPASELPIYLAGASTNARAVYIHKADFVKLRDVSITYTLPARLASRISAGNASVTLAGHNLRIWSDYPGPDPEVNTYGRVAAVTGSFARGDIYNMPMTRRLSAALNLTY